jgi:Spy/CpxP family protein refolding chaperone
LLCAKVISWGDFAGDFPAHRIGSIPMTVSMKCALRAGWMFAILAAFLAAPVMAQPPGGGFGGGGGRGGGLGNFGFAGGGFSALLSNDDVKKELQLLDDQISKVEQIQMAMGAEMRELFQSGDRDAMREKMTELGKKTEEEIAKVLDADQLKRIKEIEFQQQINRPMGGFASGILSEQIVGDLGLSKEQVDQLTEAQKLADEEFRKKQAELRAAALDKLISTLSPEQQTKFKEKYGKPFEMRMRFGGGGGAGGGGGRGQGGGRQRPGGDRNL